MPSPSLDIQFFIVVVIRTSNKPDRSHHYVEESRAVKPIKSSSNVPPFPVK